MCECVSVCVCVIVGHTDRPAQQSNQFVTNVQIIVKKKMIVVMIMSSRSEDYDGNDYVVT